MKKQLLKLVYFFLRVVSLIYILNLIIMISGNGNIEATNFIRNDINSIDSIENNGTRELNVNKIIFQNTGGRTKKFYPFDEVEFMENTGLKDKHGDYVYVGSILTDEGEQGEDEWIYGIVTKDIDDGCYISWELIEFSETLYRCSAYSVVGNIYENKELLGNE